MSTWAGRIGSLDIGPGTAFRLAEFPAGLGVPAARQDADAANPLHLGDLPVSGEPVDARDVVVTLHVLAATPDEFRQAVDALHAAAAVGSDTTVGFETPHAVGGAWWYVTGRVRQVDVIQPGRHVRHATARLVVTALDPTWTEHPPPGDADWLLDEDGQTVTDEDDEAVETTAEASDVEASRHIITTNTLDATATFTVENTGTVEAWWTARLTGVVGRLQRVAFSRPVWGDEEDPPVLQLGALSLGWWVAGQGDVVEVSTRERTVRLRRSGESEWVASPALWPHGSEWWSIPPGETVEVTVDLDFRPLGAGEADFGIDREVHLDFTWRSASL